MAIQRYENYSGQRNGVSRILMPGAMYQNSGLNRNHKLKKHTFIKCPLSGSTIHHSMSTENESCHLKLLFCRTTSTPSSLANTPPPKRRPSSKDVHRNLDWLKYKPNCNVDYRLMVPHSAHTRNYYWKSVSLIKTYIEPLIKYRSYRHSYWHISKIISNRVL